MVSIRQTTYPDSLPDFRNLGVIARVLVAVNAVALVGVLFAAPDLAQAIDRFPQIAALVEPLLLACLVVLFVLSPLLARLPYWTGCAAVMALVLLVTVMLRAGVTAILSEPPAELGRMLLLAALIGAGLLGYFRLLARAYSPALAEARLQALQARIRPHFLFNSLNAVLSLIRKDPRRAERTLEDLSDLFRTLMSDARQFVRLEDEIALLERYAEIEQLRLGERLRFTWELDTAPSDALLPPLVLQPLLENAVYHGVEPGTGAGEVLVRIVIADDEAPARERLKELLSDIAAELPTEVVGEARHGLEAVERVPASGAQVLLLDIEMPGMGGLEVARHLAALEQPPRVVFVTAHDRHAVEAFELNALDYLLKPVRAERLAAALKKAAAAAAPGREQLARAAIAAREYLSIVERHRILLVPVRDIVFLRAEQKYVTVRTRSREHLIEEPLVMLEEEFASQFVRIHRNCLVARAAIRGFERAAEGPPDEPHWLVVLDGIVERLPVSRRQWPVLRELVADKP